MRHIFVRWFWAGLFTILLAAWAFSGEAVVSTMQNVSAYFQYGGYSIEPLDTVTIAGDHGPAQRFRIARPSNGGFSIGRLYTSCTCIQVSMDKRSFGWGETAVLTVRNVLPTNGNTYPFYVQITSPIRVTLRYDTYVISDRFVVPPPVIVQPEETLPAAEPETPEQSGPELIVPTHEPPVEESGMKTEADGTAESGGDEAVPDEGTDRDNADPEDVSAPETDGNGEVMES